MRHLSPLIFCLIICSCSSNPSPVKTDLEGKTMPSFNLLLMDSTTHMNTSTIPNGKPFVVVLFSPYCPYCRAETEQILSDIKELKTIQFYFLSAFPFEPVKQFYNHYQLNNFSNIVLGQDYENKFGKYYNANAIPYLALYDKDRQLKKVFIGDVGTHVIKEGSSL